MSRLSHPADPASFPRRILVASLGLAPQVLTETLWCLAHQTPPFVPTEVHAVTTAEGRRRAELTLLDPATAVFAALAADLGLPALAGALTGDRLHVIADAEGRPLADIDGMGDNEAAADTISRLIARLTADPQAAVHVSMAGGRKTMGFLAGYALSLHGRAQDRLSHVLVSEPFQSHPHFFFPPRVPRVLVDRENRPVSTADARLVLADIPFVRLRAAQPAALLGPETSYSGMVAAMQRQFQPVGLAVDLPRGVLEAHGVAIALPPLTLAFAATLAAAALHGGGVSWRDMDWVAFARFHRLAGATQALATPPRFADLDEREALFRQQASKLRAALRRALGISAPLYAPRTAGRRPATRLHLPLPAGAVAIIGG